MILSLYAARRFLVLFVQIFAGFFALLVAIDMIDELRKFSSASITLGQALALALVNVPKVLYRILPLIAVLTAIGLFLSMARSSELVSIRAAGRSGLRFLIAPALTAFLIGIFAVTVLNPIVAATTRRYEVLEASHTTGGQILSVGGDGLWLRQGSTEGQTVIQATQANLDGTLLSHVTFLTFDPGGTPRERIEAETAQLAPGEWRLGPARRWDLALDNPERHRTDLPAGGTLPTDLTAAKIRDGFGTPDGISIWNLPGFIASLQNAGFSARAHMAWFQSELALPLFMAAQVLIAAGFTMRHVRAQRTGVYVLAALLTGFGVYFLRNFGRVLGENGEVPILAAAWTPTIAVFLLALALLLHLEDG